MLKNINKPAPKVFGLHIPFMLLGVCRLEIGRVLVNKKKYVLEIAMCYPTNKINMTVTQLR